MIPVVVPLILSFLFMLCLSCSYFFFFFQAEDGIRDHCVTGVQTCALPICFVVRDAVPTWCEDHRGRRDPGDVVRVVPGLAQDVAVADAELLGGIADEQIGRASCRERV